jgi:hypothetical protein
MYTPDRPSTSIRANRRQLPRFIFLLIICILSISKAPSVQALTLTWRAPDSGPSVAGYYLYMWDTGFLVPRRIDVGDTTSHRITGLVEGRTYSFYLTAYSAHGLESDPSNTFVYDVPVRSVGPQMTISPLPGYGILMTWSSEASKSYVVIWKSGFAEPNWKAISPVITAIGPSTSWAVGKNSQSDGFYAVKQLD